jgi:hypothetical protein
MKRFQFTWIDDKTNKIDSYRSAIEAGLTSPKIGAAISDLEVKEDFLTKLAAWTAETTKKKRKPDLIIIDQVYNVTLPFGLNGSTVAHLLRGAFPFVPMVCVTAQPLEQNAYELDEFAEYTAVFPYTHLEQYIEDLYAIARDYKKLAVPEGTPTKEHLVKSLHAPKREQSDLLRILPDEFQLPAHAGTGHRIGRWIYNILRKRPGFLYDRLHAATLLGLTESGFTKVQERFSKALYRGVFALESSPLWWASELRKILFSLTPADGPDVPQYAGRKLPGIDVHDYSVCYISKKPDPPPDTVAFSDATRDAQRRVARREFTTQHPSDAGLTAGFETQVILRRAD